MSELIERLRGKANDKSYKAKPFNLMMDAADALEARDKTIAELVGALNEIRELNLENEDENGHRWANSDMINQTVVLAISQAQSKDKAE